MCVEGGCVCINLCDVGGLDTVCLLVHLWVLGTLRLGFLFAGPEDVELRPDVFPGLFVLFDLLSLGHIAFEAALIFLPVLLLLHFVVDLLEVACTSTCACINVCAFETL